MKLREHPFMSYRGVPNWPPAWVQTTINGVEVLRRVEIGILELAMVHARAPTKIFLVIRDHDYRYVGSLLFDDVSSCQRVHSLLDSYIGRSIEEIGDLDLALPAELV